MDAESGVIIPAGVNPTAYVWRHNQPWPRALAWAVRLYVQGFNVRAVRTD
ncbi:hypothetical protein [Microbispora sp. NPDC049125]